MADAETKLRLQHAHATNALNYGHLGTATYLEHSKEWTFLRDVRSEHSEKSIAGDGSSKSAAFPFELIDDELTTNLHQSDANAVDLDMENRAPLSRTLFRRLPEILPETGYNRLEAVSIPHSESGLQPCQLAFGGAAVVSRNEKSRRTVPIAAIVAGKHQEAVRLLAIEKESVQLQDQQGQSRRYQLPKIGYEEETCWVGNGDPVQQVYFASACDNEGIHSAWMAARCRSATTIFHPLFHQSQFAADNSKSRLTANPILSIPISRTGGYSHSDVAFHPEDYEIIAIVDVRGNWSIWKLDGRHRKQSNMGQALLIINLQSSGRLMPDLQRSSILEEWHKITWISRNPQQTDRFLISSHSNAALFDLTGNDLGVVDMRLGKSRDGQRVLDVAKSSTNPSHCYILTSTKILLMSAAEDDWTDPTKLQYLTMILSWPHFRAQADTSLHLILVETAQATTVLICSSQSHLLTACRIGLKPEQSPTPVSLADPVHFYLRGNEGTEPTTASTTLLAFKDLQLQWGAKAIASEGDPVIFRAFLWQTGSPLQQLLYRCADRNSRSTFGQPYSSAIPVPQILAVHRQSTMYVDDDDLDDFLVRDDLDPWAFAEKNIFAPEADSDGDIHRSEDKIESLDWQDVYNTVAGADDVISSTDRPLDLSDALKRFQLEVQDQSNRPAVRQTLHELIPTKVILDDPEGSSRVMADLVSNQDLNMAQLTSSPYYSHPATPSDIYEEIEKNWLLPLSPDLENKIRLNKSRIARLVTAELTIAGMAVGPAVESGTRPNQTEDQQATDGELALENLLSSPATNNTLSSAAAAAAAENPILTRLRKYTTVNPPTSTSAALSSPNLTSLLAHLPTSITVPPESYSWSATEARLKSSQLPLSPKSQRRADRQARRLEKQREIINQTQALEAFQAPPVLLSSSQVIVGSGRDVQSSQAGPLVAAARTTAMNEEQEEEAMAISMTQPAAGNFGSRAKMKQGTKGKQQRMKGF